MPEIYVSTDIETDGPIPGVNSMLSLAGAAYAADGELLGTFTANLERLPGASQDARTMDFWRTEDDAWRALQADPEEPAAAMARYREWLSGLPGQPVFVAYPVGFDFTFVHWYLHRFTGGTPFGHAALDIKTMAMSLLGAEYGDAGKEAWPERWRSRGSPHTHVALEDAIEQGQEFCRMLGEVRARGVTERRA